MLFTHDKKLVNLARCDPRILKGAVNPHSSKGADARVLTFNDSSQPAVSLVPIRVTHCYLQTPNPANRKSISGIMHSQDVERFIAVSCMVFNEDNLTAPLYNNAFSFETRPASGRSFTPPSSPSKPSSSLRSPKKTLGSQSILTKSNGANQGGYVKTSLAADEEGESSSGLVCSVNALTDATPISKLSYMTDGTRASNGHPIYRSWTNVCPNSPMRSRRTPWLW